MKKFIIIIIIETLVIFLLGFILITEILKLNWSRKEVFVNCQPGSVEYDSYDPYCILIVDNTGMFRTTREIWVTKSIDHNYRYRINYPDDFYVWDKKMEMELDSHIVWDSEGISIGIYDLVIVIPKEKFIGGR